MKHMKLSAVLLAIFVLAPFTAEAASTASTKVVQGFYNRLVDTMKKGDQLGYAGRYKSLAPIIKSSFNLPLMTRFAVGPAWSNTQPAEQKQLVSAFSDFSVATYASRFAKYDGEKFEVVGEKPASNGGTIVETKLTPKDSEPIALNYLVQKDDTGTLRIVDVFLDATISELATRRAEFSSILNRDGVSALVTTLSEKSKQMGPS